MSVFPGQGFDSAALAPNPADYSGLDLTSLAQRNYLPFHGITGRLNVASGQAYFVWLGRVLRTHLPSKLFVFCEVAGLGGQTCEIGYASTPQPPNGASQTVTILVATGTVDSFLSTGEKANTGAFTYYTSQVINLWGAFRNVMATTQPQLSGFQATSGRRNFLITAGAAALAAGNTYTGALPAFASSGAAPQMMLSMDS